jgi:hypothetical protein
MSKEVGMTKEKSEYMVKPPREVNAGQEYIPVQDQIYDLKSRMRYSNKIEARLTHLELYAALEIPREHVQVARGVLVSDNVMQSVVNVRRAPEGVRGPPGSEHTRDKMSKAMPM